MKNGESASRGQLEIIPSRHASAQEIAAAAATVYKKKLPPLHFNAEEGGKVGAGELIDDAAVCHGSGGCGNS